MNGRINPEADAKMAEDKGKKKDDEDNIKYADIPV